jgi:hypothetical protein
MAVGWTWLWDLPGAHWGWCKAIMYPWLIHLFKTTDTAKAAVTQGLVCIKRSEQATSGLSLRLTVESVKFYV